MVVGHQLQKKPPRGIAELYDRRMSIEEQFRDDKGCRFGMKMEWTKFESCEAISRLFLLAALALIIWTAAGILACRKDRTMRLVSKSKGQRRSFLAIGIEARGCIAKVLRAARQTVLRLLPKVEIRMLTVERKK